MLTLKGYCKITKISEGSTTVVYRGERIRDGRNVAIAILKERYPSVSELTQFRNQYIITHDLDLAGIVKIYALENFGNGYALIMEDFRGISWLEYFNAKDTINLSRQQLWEFFQTAIRVVKILAKLDRHQIIHQKIQPQNILIDPDTKQVKLRDFSLACLSPKNRQVYENYGFINELLPYISPEQTGRINRGIDYRSDYYSLGVTFYQLLTGRLPFNQKDPIELIYSHLATEPIAPSQLNPSIPKMVSNIVLKLMAKNPEERYQTALGLKSDLEKCRQQWQEQNQIVTFDLGLRDIRDRLIISDKLYGREGEIATILDVYERVCRGNKEMLVVSGSPGVGKTALIERASREILRQKSFFLQGKFDRLIGDRPLSAIISTFQGLIFQLQTESTENIELWRRKLLEALGDNAGLIIEVIPELETLLDKQPPVSELEPDAAQNRFKLVFSQFIRVFATFERPLVIFLDDLQWADLASLRFIQLLMSDRDLDYLLLIGAYRDSEVSSAHPLIIELEGIEGHIRQLANGSVAVNRISLSPLNLLTLNGTIADSLCCSEALAYPLTESIWQKSQGNPLFAIEILQFFHREGLITFDPYQGCWQCDLAKIKVIAVSDDVVEFMRERLKQLPRSTQNLLKIAACIGSEFDLKTLAIARGKSDLDIAIELRQALQEGLVLPTSEIYHFALGKRGTAREDFNPTSYQFLHDRVQEAAYGLIPESEKIATHFQIGRLLLERTPLAAREEKIFAIVNHLNMAVEQIESQSERERLAELNLTAGNKAKSANAFPNAFNYFSTALKLLPQDCWETKYELAFTLSVAAAEAAYLCGNFEPMELLVADILRHGRSLLDRIKAYEVKIYAYIAQGEPLQAVKVALKVLELLGVRFPLKPNKLQLLGALVRTKLLLARKEIASLSDLSRMSDPKLLAVMRIMGIVGSPAYNASPNLAPLLALKAVNLSIRYGNAPMSIYGYASYGVALCGALGRLNAGYQFGKLALNLLEKLQAEELKPRTLMVFNNFIRHWQEHPQAGLEPLKDAYCSGLKTGDVEFASYAVMVYSYHSYLIGKELTELEREIAKYLEFISRFKQETALNILKVYYQVIYNLMNTVADPTCLKGEHYDEELTLPLLLNANHLSAICHLYCHKLILSYLFEKCYKALEYADRAKQYLSGVKATLIVPLFHFYDSLTRLAVYDSAALLEQKSLIIQVKVNQKKLKTWSKSAPMNYWHKYYLVEAEKQRVLGKYLQAIENYDRAIRLAKTNNYPNDLALAQELTGKFYLTWDKEDIARLYLTDAYYSYARWGATAKVKCLAKKYSRLLAPILNPQLSPTETTDLADSALPTQSVAMKNLQTGSSASPPPKGGVPFSEGLLPLSVAQPDSIDLNTIIKTSQAISQEIKLDRLLANLMDAIIKNSGAQTGYLILCDRNSNDFFAAAIIDNDSVKVEFASAPLKALKQNIPTTIINQVKFTAKPIVLDGEIENTIYAADPYFVKFHPQSILCIPIIDRSKTTGILYLENNLTKNVFTGDRLEVLNILCSQAAISLRNANLYQDLQYSEVKAKQKAQQLEQSLVELQQSKQQLLELQQQLEYDALHDPLTGLANRALLTKLLERAIDLAARHPHYLYACMFLDLDRFKIINDTMGHLFGDELLKQVAQRLTSCMRSSDTVARLGGDEFAILLEKIENREEATAIVHRIQEQFARPFLLANQKICTSTSIGITFSTNNYQRSQDILRDADLAMYRAKSQGRGSYFIFDFAGDKTNGK